MWGFPYSAPWVFYGEPLECHGIKMHTVVNTVLGSQLMAWIVGMTVSDSASHAGHRRTVGPPSSPDSGQRASPPFQSPDPNLIDLYANPKMTPRLRVHPRLETPGYAPCIQLSFCPPHNRSNARRCFFVVDLRQEWDDNLAARAQEWAEQCTNGHGMQTE